MASFIDNPPYWEQRLATDPDAKYRFYLVRMALKLQDAMPVKKMNREAKEVLKSVKKVLALESDEYSYRRRLVMLCNIQMMNQYKLECQHGVNFNRKLYSQLANVGIEYPIFDEVDTILSHFIRLKRALLMFLSRDLVILQWPRQQYAAAEVTAMKKFVEQIVAEIRMHVIRICYDTEHIPDDTLHYIDIVISRYHQQTFPSDEMLKRLQRVKQHWEVPDALMPSV